MWQFSLKQIYALSPKIYNLKNPTLEKKIVEPWGGERWYTDPHSKSSLINLSTLVKDWLTIQTVIFATLS